MRKRTQKKQDGEQNQTALGVTEPAARLSLKANVVRVRAARNSRPPQQGSTETAALVSFRKQPATNLGRPCPCRPFLPLSLGQREVD